MKCFLIFFLAVCSATQVLAQAAEAPREERVLIPLTAEQLVANTNLNLEVRRAEAEYARQRGEVEEQVRERQVKLADDKLLVDLLPCTNRLDSMNASLDRLDVERQQRNQNPQQARAGGQVAPLSDIDKLRASLMWERDAVRIECENHRKRLQSQRDQIVAAEIRRTVPAELQKLEREQERLLKSLEQRRHRPQIVLRQLVAEPRATRPPEAPTIATATPSKRTSGSVPDVRSGPSVPAERSAAKAAPAPKPSQGATASPSQTPASDAQPAASAIAPVRAEASPATTETALNSGASGTTPVRPKKQEPSGVFQAVASVTAMFQGAQDAVIDMVSESPMRKLNACASGRKTCQSAVYTTLLPGMERAAVLKAIGQPITVGGPEQDVWSYTLPAKDALPALGFRFQMFFETDRVVAIKPVVLD